MIKNTMLFNSLLIGFGLMTVGCMNSNNSLSAQEVAVNSETEGSMNSGPSLFLDQSGTEIFMAVGSRFNATITKADLNKATSILEIVPSEETAPLKSHANVRVGVIDKGLEIVEKGANENLNEAQLKLLRSTDYSTDFFINADSKRKHVEAWEIEGYELVYYFTIIPEVEAVYSDGLEALISNIEENTKELKSTMTEEGLRAGKARFTVSEIGTITDVFLDVSCGYPAFDQAVIELIGSVPGTWTPAQNQNGEKVAQELVFSFGQIGC